MFSSPLTFLVTFDLKCGQIEGTCDDDIYQYLTFMNEPMNERHRNLAYFDAC